MTEPEIQCSVCGHKQGYMYTFPSLDLLDGTKAWYCSLGCKRQIETWSLYELP